MDISYSIPARLQATEMIAKSDIIKVMQDRAATLAVSFVGLNDTELYTRAGRISEINFIIDYLKKIYP